MRKILLTFFVIIIALGLCHGFPLIDLFADEMYFVYGPLTAMQRGSLLPSGVTYGTVTFYMDYFLQGLILLIPFVFTGFHVGTLTELIMQYPFIAYFAPRILSGMLFLAMLIMAMNIMNLGKQDERPYAAWIITILFGNLVLLTFSHSGKMWITSIFFIFLAGILFRKSARNAMIAASLSFANFSLMGIFWLETLILSLWREKTWKRRSGVIAIAILLPAFIFLLNAESIIEQVKIVFRFYVFPQIGAEPQEARAFTESFALLYGKTFLSTIVKILKTSLPALLLCLLAWRTKATIRDKHCFFFSVIGFVLYLIGISAMVYSRVPTAYFRYLLPFQILFLLFFLSIEFRHTKFMTICMRSMGILSLYLVVIHTCNMVLPTTYQEARQQLIHTHNNPETVILSQVSELSFPYNERSARLQLEVDPGKCGNRCRYALDHHQETVFKAAFLSLNDGAPLPVIPQTEQSAIIHVRYEQDPDYVDVEHQLGSYFIKEAWRPGRLGRGVIME